ncbi:tryptophan--tRNA ligase [Caldicellulosiruptor naganoensis]|uniref:Tryptophan--tRNA ligase n=1 Tax=Caldicellulosiruptor naganoensis TaxID=29324 RepID=A0ABY7BE45_9FIRM|nr:tryptophan--tRNA ligase [Caldicellulosiruptor naganoensis]WAM31099.1 tryptophan--tRNA ligase [Caldicellulosiruptor naganoensis]
MKRVLSGTRPTGILHLGNYFGAIESWVKLQDQYECFFFVADWHALTTGYEDTSNLREYTKQVVIDFLACGLDPNKCTIFVQSHVPEHVELHLLFSMITPLSWLYRCPTYKDQMRELKERNIATYGFLGYPCLQAADILIYKAELVPVGEDQLPHLELTREIARRFNYLYGQTFPEPQPILNTVKVLIGTDGRKMSKSYGNTIALSEDLESVRKKVMNMVTDPARIRKNDPGHPEVCTVFAYHKIFSQNSIDEIESSCREGKIGCVECKKKLFESLSQFLEPIQSRRKELENDIDYVFGVIEEGAKKARAIASKTLKEAKDRAGLL